MTRCRSCGAAIFWAKTRRGRYLPLDAEPNPAGEWFLLGKVAHPILSATGPKVRYRCHFATCWEADKWRRRSNPTPTAAQPDPNTNPTQKGNEP